MCTGHFLRLMLPGTAALLLQASGPALAQQIRAAPMAEVYPGVYRPVASLPTAVGPVFPSLVRIDGSFRLTLVREEQFRMEPAPRQPAASAPAASASVTSEAAASENGERDTAKEEVEEEAGPTFTRSQYAANGVAITLTSMDPFPGSIRLVGRVDVVTETTLDAEGNGSIDGMLTFTSRSRNGTAYPLISVRLSGQVGESASPLVADGGLSIPATTRFERPVSAAISATLSSDAGLTARLSGIASASEISAG